MLNDMMLGQIQIHVLAPGGPPPRGRVKVINLADGQERQAVLLSGRAFCPGLAPGNYRIEVRVKGYRPAAKEGRVPARGIIQADFELAMGSPGAIKGRLIGRRPTEQVFRILAGQGENRFEAEVLEDGSFFLGPLLPGLYTLEVHGAGRVWPYPGYFPVRPGEIEELELKPPKR